MFVVNGNDVIHFTSRCYPIYRTVGGCKIATFNVIDLLSISWNFTCVFYPSHTSLFFPQVVLYFLWFLELWSFWHLFHRAWCCSEVWLAIIFSVSMGRKFQLLFFAVLEEVLQNCYRELKRIVLYLGDYSTEPWAWHSFRFPVRAFQGVRCNIINLLWKILGFYVSF